MELSRLVNQIRHVPSVGAVEDCVTDDNGADDTNGGKTITWSDIVQKDREGLSFSRNNPID